MIQPLGFPTILFYSKVTYGSKIFNMQLFRDRCSRKPNDVALLKTVRQLKWSQNLRPACLPISLSEDFSGISATVAGWGFTNEDREIGKYVSYL